jgi:hypothetical protein
MKREKENYLTMEKCVGCQKQVPISTQTNIQNRLHYIEGAGQLCAQCYITTYIKTNITSNKNTWSIQQDIYTDDS